MSKLQNAFDASGANTLHKPAPGSKVLGVDEALATDRLITIRILAQKFIERAEALKYKGKARDNAALDFFCGAAAMAELAGDLPMYRHLGNIIVTMIAVRGYMAVRQLAMPEVIA